MQAIASRMPCHVKEKEEYKHERRIRPYKPYNSGNIV